MDEDVCRRCPVAKCKLFFDEREHTVIMIEEEDYLSSKLLANTEEGDLLFDELWLHSTTVVGKNGDRLVYEKLTLPPDAPSVNDFEVHGWAFDDYFSDTEYTRMWCPCWAEQLVAFLSRRETNGQGNLQELQN